MISRMVNLLVPIEFTNKRSLGSRLIEVIFAIVPTDLGIEGHPTSFPSLIKTTPKFESESKQSLIILIYLFSNTCNGIVPPGKSTVFSGNKGRSRIYLFKAHLHSFQSSILIK